MSRDLIRRMLLDQNMVNNNKNFSDLQEFNVKLNYARKSELSSKQSTKFPNDFKHFYFGKRLLVDDRFSVLNRIELI